MYTEALSLFELESDGQINRPAIKYYSVLTLLMVSYMTTENTWRRWVVFTDWCCFTDGTADTDHSVILDASLVFCLFVLLNYYKKMDFISGQFSVLCIHDFLRSA